MKELGAPIRQWVPDWLGLICIFIVILPVTMLNGSYTGSMLEVSNTLGTNTEDITMGYYAAAAGMAVSYPIIPKILEAFSIKFLGNYIRLCTISKIIKGHMIMYPFIIQSFFSFFFPFPSFSALQERVFRKRGSRGSVFGL